MGTGKRKKWISSASASLGEQSREGDRSKLQRLAWGLAKIAGASALVLAAFVVALPSVLSTKAGLRSTLAIVNRFVPGQIAIKQVCNTFSSSSLLPCMPTQTQILDRSLSTLETAPVVYVHIALEGNTYHMLTSWVLNLNQANLGWRKPVNIENVQWGDRASEAAGSPLVEVPSITSSASLWDIAKGREYELLVSNPRIDGSLADDGTFLLQQVAQVSCWQTSVLGPSRFCPYCHLHLVVDLPLECWQTPKRDVFMQGKSASRPQAQGNAEDGAEDVRFAAEGKFLSGHIFVSDGVIHGLPSAAKEVPRFAS